MARKPTKFRSGGSSDRSQARFERRVADIDSDLARALRGASEREAQVARAKHRQRMADARDDMAKRTGGDRTQTRAAERGAEAELTRTRRQGATFSPKVDSAAPTPASSAQIAAATSPAAKTGSSGSQTFAQAFRAAREGGGKTFTWRGKSYSTKMAGGGGSSRATPRANTPAKPPAPKGNPAVKRNVTTAAVEQATGRSTTPGASTLTADQQGRAQDFRSAFQGRGSTTAPTARAATPTVTPAAARRAVAEEQGRTQSRVSAQGLNPSRTAPVTDARAQQIAEAIARREARLKEGKNPYGFAKGGSVDGIAVRGKTRAKTRKK